MLISGLQTGRVILEDAGLAFYRAEVVDTEELLASVGGVLVVGEDKSATFTAALRGLLPDRRGHPVAVKAAVYNASNPGAEGSVDATDPDALRRAVEGKRIDTVWFHCPWNSKEGVSDLVSDYLEAAAQVGQLRNVLLGVTTIQYWRQHYDLGATATAPRGLALRGKDVDVTAALCHRGYSHTSQGSPISEKRVLRLFSCGEELQPLERIEFNTEVLWYERAGGAPQAHDDADDVEALAQLAGRLRVSEPRGV
eukprot:m51a1_g12527 hypothetical protein (253) ;mRNA; r:3159-3989